MSIDEIAGTLTVALDTLKVAVVGLGYVGRPLLEILSSRYDVIGYDVDADHVDELQLLYHDNERIEVTTDLAHLSGINLFIVCVPTDILPNNDPDLSNLRLSAVTIGGILKPGSTVIFESTVYPGCTEELCIPILEEQSGLKLNKEFWVGYAPERLVPGVSSHGLADVPRVVAGSNPACTDFLYNFYGSLIDAKIHKVPSIRIAEASKLVENIQRDLNISLMNELAIIFDQLDIDSEAVFDAAATKWNFHRYYPGLVGGHCISVDPFYLLYKARSLNIEPKVIAAGRTINEFLPHYVADIVWHHLKESKPEQSLFNVLIFGATFKENIDDIRNSKVINLLNDLRNKGAEIAIVDPHISASTAAKHGIPLLDLEQVEKVYDAIILAVKHQEFLEFTPGFYNEMLSEPYLIFDLKRMIAPENRQNFTYWAL